MGRCRTRGSGRFGHVERGVEKTGRHGNLGAELDVGLQPAQLGLGKRAGRAGGLAVSFGQLWARLLFVIIAFVAVIGLPLIG